MLFFSYSFFKFTAFFFFWASFICLFIESSSALCQSDQDSLRVASLLNSVVKQSSLTKSNGTTTGRKEIELSEGSSKELEFTDAKESKNNNGDSLLSAEAVRSAIDGAIAFIKQRQRSVGDWNEYPGYEPGTTALATLALLTAGLDKNDPVVAKALEYLSTFTPLKQNQTYSISLQTMVFCLADPEEYREAIESNVAWLVERQMKTSNEHLGGWSYIGNNQESERADNSNSQFALLALYEAELAGINVPEETWNSAEEYWVRMQNDDGSWGYRSSSFNPSGFPSGYGTGSMTCAGISALAICSGVRELARAKIEGESVLCCQDVEDDIATRVSRGLAWLGKHFSVQTNPGHAVGSDSYFFYYLYGLERVGRLTANRFVGQSDWYREGAEVLLRRKGVLSQFWNAQKDLSGNNIVSTAFALLFLSKGRWPILASKMKFGDSDDWNAHPNDLAHLTTRVEQEWNTHLIWQTIDSKKASLDDLLQTPILVMSGSISPVPEDREEKERLVANLRGYLEQGGFIFAEAIDGDVSFESGFRELIGDVLAEDGGELQLLDPSHPIWTVEKIVDPKFSRPILGVDYGCRTSVVFVPAYRPIADENGRAPSVDDDRASLSCLWEAAKNRVRESDVIATSDKIKGEMDAAFAIGINICAYATERRMKYKEEVAVDAGSELEKGSDIHNSLFVAILECGGGSSCAPRAIPNLMKSIRTRFGVPTQTHVSRITAKTQDVFDYPILFMHGRNSFAFSEKERENLRLYFERGGFLFVNAVCASKAFEKSFLEEILQVFPEEQLVDIPKDDPIFTSKYGGFQIEKLQYRTRQVDKSTGVSKSIVVEGPVRLKGIQRGGRWIVIYSPDDVSCALENVTAANCNGLTQSNAFYLGTNVLFYAAELL